LFCNLFRIPVLFQSSGEHLKNKVTRKGVRLTKIGTYSKKKDARKMERLYLYTCGGNIRDPGPGLMGMVICTPEDKILFERGRPIQGVGCTVIQAEYAAMIQGLLTCGEEFEAEDIKCFSRSRLLVGQMHGEPIGKMETARLYQLAVKACSRFRRVGFTFAESTHPMIARAEQLMKECSKKRVSTVVPGSSD
jgi:ribonuclease HI